jgi:hypothetical protein
MNQPHLTEKEITSQIRSVLKTFHIFHYKAWGGPMSEKGIPDIIGCIDGKFFAIEVKTKVGKMSDYQEAFRRRITEAGGLHIIARSLDDVMAGLNLKKAVLF